MPKIRSMRGYPSEVITRVTLDAKEAFLGGSVRGFPGPGPRRVRVDGLQGFRPFRPGVPGSREVLDQTPCGGGGARCVKTPQPSPWAGRASPPPAVKP
jgi:hypothetical protein